MWIVTRHLLDGGKLNCGAPKIDSNTKFFVIGPKSLMMGLSGAINVDMNFAALCYNL